MRVGFTLIGGKDWTGGSNYLFNLLRVLGRFQAQELTPVVFADEMLPESDHQALRSISGVEVVLDRRFGAWRHCSSLVRAMIIGRDSALNECFKTHGIDVAFEAAQFFGWRLGIPTLAWISDLQHKALPGLFPWSSRWRREIGFRFQVRAGRTIMLSSEDARTACELYYPHSRGRTHVVPFAVLPGEPISFSAAKAVSEAYGLPEHFIFLPNQFWRHKNHDLVLDALRILHARGRRVVIAASGRQVDPRYPEYFHLLAERIAREGLSHEFRLLGLIPYPHLGALMRACSAMLNPSLFEGWSTSVEEARNLGTPMILSDLPVHREQMAEEAVYFHRYSAESLADALQAVRPQVPAVRDVLAADASEQALVRAELFARNFTNTIRTALKTY